MAPTHFSSNKSGAMLDTNLSAVTSATNGTGIGARDFNYITFGFNVSVNSGAVTINSEWSPDNSVWFSLDSQTYTAATGKTTFNYVGHFPFVRATTTTHSSSTVTAYIAGGR